MLRNVERTRLEYDLSRVLSPDSPEWADIAAKLPAPDWRLSFDLLGSSTAMANAIRRVSMAELSVAFLTADKEVVKTSSMRDGLPDREFIPQSFLLRLQHIRIPHDTEDSYTLKVENKTSEKMVVYSRHLVSKRGGPLPFDGTYRLAMLSPKCVLEVAAITVERGYGYRASHAFTTGSYHYDALDYRPVSCLGNNGRAETIWVSRADLLGHGLKKPLTPRTSQELLRIKPLFIPEDFRARPEAIKEKLSDWGDVRYVATLPQHCSATVVRVRDYHLEFRLSAVHDPETHLRRVFLALKERLTRLQSVLPQMTLPLPSSPSLPSLQVGESGEKAEKAESGEKEEGGEAGTAIKVTIVGEDSTLGRLLTEKVFDLDNRCFVNCIPDSRRERTLILRVGHPTPERLLEAAFTACIKDVQALLDQT